ncbi:hypothetical protein BDV95DRAFT_33915 [Massariosphaeria phaeospora]|uniref:BTB domain-containing protein n=1 Tax=Massariosphaeria phaeospora TaxID=100035 RepID=A0A7C8MLD1_9PLEO|nr:hypothetical protein BDV95DRAFT_33915 [Massariosphaeria phaeospora]
MLARAGNLTLRHELRVLFAPTPPTLTHLPHVVLFLSFSFTLHISRSSTLHIMPTTLGPIGAFPDQERDHLLKLMRGPAVEILVGPKRYDEPNERIWALSKSWISYHSKHFKSMCGGYLLRTNRVIIDSEPDTFALFVEFMFRGQYTCRDEFGKRDGILEAAKAWILGDQLEATKFQNLAMHKLYMIYKPGGRAPPLCGLTAHAIRYICENCAPDSLLYVFFNDVAVAYWTNREVVVHEKGTQREWLQLFKKYPYFRDKLLTRLGAYGPKIKYIKEYFIADYEQEEPDIPESPPENPPPGYSKNPFKQDPSYVKGWGVNTKP